MTGSAADPPAWQAHIGNKTRRDALAKRAKKPNDPLKLVIVRDIWLTGFDAPSMHTMYVDKPMKGHGLMQAIARVNRVFRDKPAGLVVDYIGIAQNLKNALGQYSGSDRGQTGIDEAEAVAVLALSKAFALASSSDEARAIRDDVGFFQTVRAALAKSADGAGQSNVDREFAIQQILDRAVVSTEIVDILAAAGLATPDISILSDEFLAEVQHLEKKNLALEARSDGKRLTEGDRPRTARQPEGERHGGLVAP